MKNGWFFAAVSRRYWTAPSVPASGVPSEFMKRPSLSKIPPPSSGMVWSAPASGGSQRVNPYLLTSSGTQVIPLAGLLQ